MDGISKGIEIKGTRLVATMGLIGALCALSGCDESCGLTPCKAATSATASTAEGLWSGTTSSGRSFAGVVLDDGTAWLIYSEVGNSAVIAGATQGSGTSSDGNFNSSNGIDFNLEGLGVNNFSMAATYTAKSTLDGTYTYSSTGSSYTFTSSYSADYELTPSLAAIAGTYSGSAATSGGIEQATVNVSNTGALTGSSAGGCMYTGTALPRAKGNVYDMSVTFAGGTCANGTNTVTGISYFNANTKQLTSMALNSGRTDGYLYVGNKQ